MCVAPGAALLNSGPALTIHRCRFEHPGRVVPGAEIRSVSPERKSSLPEGFVGELWLASPGLALGYYNNHEATSAAFGFELEGSDRRWYRTGDLGFLLGGEVFICGRIKDVMIFCGKNHYPQDVELTAEQADNCLRPGCIAAFSTLSGDAAEGELLVVVAEVRDKALGTEACADVVSAVQKAVRMHHGLSCHEVCSRAPLPYRWSH
mgnify:CR=1 FL=1